ncbi:disease resistance protein Pik-2-like [Triticum dicoccoides]|uniref:disease resistance protein Pik-2-like n=1 Tax=Triticum dicoccoides TaxID=85692 RepID=UPI00188F3C7A|nr:disease resistance protein Pik-2-like [Triticum dicoccoides]
MESGAQTILINVGQLVGQEFWQLRAVGGEIAELKEELATMNTLLRMQSEANESGLCHFVREWMKQLRELAYDAEDCVDLYLFRIRCRQGDGFLVWSKRLLATLFPRHRLAGEITALASVLFPSASAMLVTSSASTCWAALLLLPLPLWRQWQRQQVRSTLTTRTPTSWSASRPRLSNWPTR